MLNDIQIPAGETVVCFIDAGNRDPKAFPAPDTFDFGRDGNLSRQLA